MAFESPDKFCLDGSRLVGKSGTYGTNGAEYRTEKDSFTKIVSVDSGTGLKFVAYTKSGRVREYTPVSATKNLYSVSLSDGSWVNSATSQGARDVLWVLSSEKDRSGNTITYEYQNLTDADGLDVAPHRIRYTSNGATPSTRYVEFGLEARPDKKYSFEAGVAFKQTRRLKTVAMYAPNPSTTSKVWQYDLTYTTSERTSRSLLASVKRCASAGGCMYSKNFGWSEGSASPFTARTIGTGPGEGGYMHVLDVNGDGLDDVVYGKGTSSTTRLGTRSSSGSPNPLSQAVVDSLGAAAAADMGRPVDIDMDGKDEIWVPVKNLTSGTWRAELRRWDGDGFATTGISGSIPCTENLTGQMMWVNCGDDAWIDLEGDGRLDLVYMEKISGSTQSKVMVRHNNGGSLGEPQDSGARIGQEDKVTSTNDLHADGRSEVIINKDGDSYGGYTFGHPATGSGNEWGTSPNSGKHKFFTTSRFQGDFNGDGLRDWIVESGGSSYSLMWNTDTGVKYASSNLSTLGLDQWYRAGTGDMNDDGRDDLILRNGSATAGLAVAYSNGDGTFKSIVSMTPATASYNAMYASNDWRTGDFNGDGRTDFLYVNPNNQLIDVEQNAIINDRIETITDQGAPSFQYRVSYHSQWSNDDSYPFGNNASCSYPLHCIRTGMIVAKQVTSPQGTFQYDYLNPVRDLRGRGFLGFGKMRIWEPGRPSEKIVTYNNQYRTTMPFPLVGGEKYPYAFSPATVTITTPILTASEASSHPTTATARITRTTYTREVRADGYAYTAPLTSSTSKTWEESVNINWGTPTFQRITGITTPATADRQDTGTFDYDAYGNQTFAKVATAGGVTRETTTAFDNRTADWLIGLPTRVTETRKEADTAIPAVSRTVTYTNDVLGRREKTETEKDSSDTSLQSTVTQTYDAYGLVTSTTISAPELPTRTERTAYAASYPGAPDEHIFPSQVWSDHNLEQYRPSTWMAVHPAIGEPVAAMDVNGVQKTTTYDGFGRPVTESLPGKEAATHTYAGRAVTGGTDGLVVTSTQGSQAHTVATDAAGYKVSESAKAFNGQTSTVDLAYDALNRPRSVTEPYRGTTPTGKTEYTYDSLDRMVQTDLPNASTIVNTYSGLFQTTSDRAGTITKETRDKNGRIVSSVNDPMGKNVATTYVWGPFDTLTRVTDDDQHVTTMGYDKLGRRTSLTEPDAGTTQATFYGTGDLRRETHTGTGEFSEMAYDDLGRGISRTTNDGVNTFVWDSSANGIGQIASTVSADNIRTQYTYDTLGRQTGMDYIDGVTNTTYSTERSYDAAGRTATVSYPTVPGRNRYTLHYDYNTYGYLTKITDTTPGQTVQQLWQTTARTANDSLDTATLGSGTSAIALDLGYKPETGQLTDIDAVRVDGTGTKLTDLLYDYHPNGLVKRQYDAVNNRGETYSYDTLGRLTGWTMDQVTISYDYDDVGNMTSIKKNGVVTESRGHGKADGSQPHTLTSVTPAGQSAQQFVYDSKGRQTQGAGRQTTYTQFNLPKTVTKGGKTTTYSYDAFGTRVKESSPDGTTFYVPGTYEKRTTGSTTKHVFHIDGTDGRIGQAVFDGTSTKVEYNLTDALGNVTSTVTAQGQQKYFYDPFGARINADRTPYTGTTGDTTRGFTGHEHDDDLGTINMKGRIYDPKNKTFLTPDPLVTNPGNSQSWNPYTYVRNSPLNYTDPSGFETCTVTKDGITCTTEIVVIGKDPSLDSDIERWFYHQIAGGDDKGDGHDIGGGGAGGAGGSGPDGYKAPGDKAPGDKEDAATDVVPEPKPKTKFEQLMDDLTDYGIQKIAETIVTIVCLGNCGAANGPTSDHAELFNSPTDAQVLGGAVKAAIEVVGLPGPVDELLDSIPGSDMVADEFVEEAIDTVVDIVDQEQDYKFPEERFKEKYMPQNGPNDK